MILDHITCHNMQF